MKQIVSSDADWSHSFAETVHALDDFAPPFDFFRSCFYDRRNVLPKHKNSFGFFVASFMHPGYPFRSTGPIQLFYRTGFSEMDGRWGRLTASLARVMAAWRAAARKALAAGESGLLATTGWPMSPDWRIDMSIGI